MASYLIPACPVEIEYKVKRSLFICRITHAPDRDAAVNFIEEIRAKHSDANHNCWAYVAGPPADPANWGMNDDGEPKGCAGKPMFNVIHHANIGEICTVVTRYFGGIKLGTGGMARAYGTSVQLALDELQTSTKRFYHRVCLTTPYEQLKNVEHLADQFEAITIDRIFDSNITLTIDLPEGKINDFQEQLQSLSRGQITLTKP